MNYDTCRKNKMYNIIYILLRIFFQKNKNPEVCLSTGTTGYYNANIRVFCIFAK